MKYYELEREEAQKIFNSICEGSITIDENYFNQLDKDYSEIRKTILSWIDEKPVKKSYEFDLYLALKIYNYFSNKNFPDFNEAIASNYGFWRYICLKVVPDIIIKRHGLIKEYFYAKNVRLYIPTLWWYIEMCYQGSDEATYECLNKLSTDYILQIVERPGRDGMFLDVFRLMINYLTRLPNEVMSASFDDKTLLRRLLIQNTAKNSNYNLVIEGKIKEYVIELFRSCGVEVSDYGIE